ncbi:MAG: HAMP domain-containing protein [Treponema sp.]|nr:HAMP domain-containing protein [Treponema sp.]
MKKKLSESFAAQLSLRFMFIITTSVIFISVFFLFFTWSLARNTQTQELMLSENRIYEAISEREIDFSEEISDLESSMLFMGIPYYVTYIVYLPENGSVLATNDPFLPLLPDTKGKAVRHLEKDFFFDGNLDVIYLAQTHLHAGKSFVIAVAVNMDNNSWKSVFSKLPAAILFMAIPVLILSFLFSFFIARRTIKPVMKITKAAQSMTTEDLDALLPLTGKNDEIDELSRTFNELFIRIKADFERERQFSSDVSHELNTPLTVITGQTNLLLRWGKDNPQQLEKSLNSIKNESKSMHAIIENLLHISRIESGRIKPQFSAVKLDELFARIETEARALTPEINITCSGAGIEVFSDSEMLHQIITVFVSNSIKFAGEKSSISLYAEKKENRVYIEEYDDGPGISEEDLPHVFERFYRADQAHTRKAGGSGLGLSIAKTLSSALGYEILADNVNPHGAKFTIIIKS